MATESIYVPNVDVKIEVKTELGEVTDIPHTSAYGIEDIHIEELDLKRVNVNEDSTCLSCSSSHKGPSLLPKIIDEKDAKKLENWGNTFSILECPQCDKTFRRAQVPRLTKHVLEHHKKCSKELLRIIHYRYGLL